MRQTKGAGNFELSYLKDAISCYKAADTTFGINEYQNRQERETCNSYNNDFWKRDPCIAPIRDALST